MELNKEERKKLITRISGASGIAQYALEEKMTNEQVIEASNNIDIFLLLKAANNYNRYCQSQKTADANAKLKQFIDLKNSELYKAGQWLTNALSKVGQARKQSLLEKNVVHKDDYNTLVEESAQAMDSISSKVEKQDKILLFVRQDLGAYKYNQIMTKYKNQLGS